MGKWGYKQIKNLNKKTLKNLIKNLTLKLKTLLLRSKHIQKFKGKCAKANEPKKATFSLNNPRSAKYGYSPEQIEEQALDPETGKYFQEVYDFHQFIKIKENRDQIERFLCKS